MPTPVGAIFLIGFGHGFIGTDQSRNAVGRRSILGQLSAAMLDPVWVPHFDPIELGVFEAELTELDGE